MSHIVTCPHCSTQIRVPDWNTHKTLFCPRCLAEVDNVWPGSPIQAADINTEVKRDLSVGSIVLAVLIGLCVLGITITFFAPFKHDELGLGRIFSLMWFFVALDFLVTIAIVRGVVRSRTSGARAPSGGRVIGIILLSLGTFVAVCIFFFFTCGFLITVGRF